MKSNIFIHKQPVLNTLTNKVKFQHSTFNFSPRLYSTFQLQKPFQFQSHPLKSNPYYFHHQYKQSQQSQQQSISKPTLIQKRYYRNRRDLFDDDDKNIKPITYNYAQDHTKPDPVAFLRQHEQQLLRRDTKINNPANGINYPQSERIAEFLTREETKLKDKVTFFQKLRFQHPFTHKTKIEEDLPMIIQRNDLKHSSPQLLLPMGDNWPMWKLWNLPPSINLPRRDMYIPLIYYSLAVITYCLIAGIPIAIDHTRDAEVKHRVLFDEVKKEEKHLHYLHSIMTIEEISRAMSSLPRKPGEAWNPEEEAERERISKRLFYPH